jgi:8-oxo-dGTP pyrophosphatase MutT (NUDIX family)
MGELDGANRNISAADFARAAAGRLHASPRAHDGANGKGDHSIDPGPPMMDFDSPREAAVLIPILDQRGHATVLLTRRTDHLPTHAGQIAFPGGKIDPGDATPAEAAMREAKEEVGLDRCWINPIGYLDPYLSRTGYLITPVVSIVRRGFELSPNEGEVAEIFEVPLGFLMNADNHRQDHAVFRGARRTFYAMPYGERYIWGATAGILHQLYETVYG